MSEDILFDSGEYPVTFEHFDSISEITGQVAESHERENESCRPNKIVSLVSLFQEFQCLEGYNGHYTSVPLPASQKWESLFKFAQSVKTIELDQNAVQEANRIPPSVFIHLALQLKSGHLFPNVSAVELKNFDVSTHYFPLLLSPYLEEFSIEFASNSQWKEVTTVRPPFEGPVHSFELILSLLLDNLAFASRTLQSLKLKNIPDVPCLTLAPLSQLSHLRILELANSIHVKSFTDFCFLDSLPHLEDLSIVAKGRDYIGLASSFPHDERCLLSLKSLRVTANLKILLDLLRKIASADLKHLTFNHSKAILQPSKKKKVRASDQVDWLEILSSRWPRSLKELVIVTSQNLKCSFRYLVRLQVLDSLHIQGCSMNEILAVFVESSGFRDSLRSLHLTGAPLPFGLLKQIAEYAPSLIKLSLSLDITDTSYADDVRVVNHPLRLLEIHHDATHRPEVNGDNFMQLVRVTRYLNTLFPNIQDLTASTKESEWEKVWQLVKLCRDSRWTEDSGKMVEGESFEMI